jgi:hypothetical protein
MFRRRRAESPLWLDLLFGAAAGVIGTLTMSPARNAIARFQSQEDQVREVEVSYPDKSPARAAKKLAEPLGVELEDPKRAGHVISWTYGTLWGVAYALITRRRGWLPLLGGWALGTGLWAIGDEILVPALRLAPGPKKFPLSTHAKALGCHLAYGSGVDLGLRTLRAVSRAALH